MKVLRTVKTLRTVRTLRTGPSIRPALGAGPAAAGTPTSGAAVAQLAASTQPGPDPTLAMIEASRGLAPFSPSQNMSTDHVPTLVLGGQKDPTVTPSYLRAKCPYTPVG